MVSSIQNKKEIIMDNILRRAVWPIILVPGLFLALMWNRLPDQVALHFDLKGEPDRMGSRDQLLLTAILLIVMNAVIYLIITNIYRIDPKKYAAENKSRLYRIAFASALFLSVVLCMIIYSASHGNVRFSMGIMLSATGLFFAFIGNYLPNLKPNYFAGIRVPWTLENEDNWRKTHALAGKLWFAGGLLLALICLFLAPTAAIVVFFSIMGLIVIIPILYSYMLYRNKKQLSKH
jgi:uncharacterized membrane protein